MKKKSKIIIPDTYDKNYISQQRCSKLEKHLGDRS